LRELIGRIEYTSGGDFVDALADALDRCSHAGWRTDPAVRRMLLIVGDSPGFSVLDPAPMGADAHPRRLDVDMEVMKLHDRHSVEVATLYVEPEPETARTKDFYRYARDQYQSLATIQRYYWASSAFEPKQAAQAVMEGASAPALARKRSYCVLDGVEARAFST
jgi:hypothetical protein